MSIVGGGPIGPMTKRSPKPRDLNELAAAIVRESTQDFEEEGPGMDEETLDDEGPED
jgi:hypothetical protein